MFKLHILTVILLTQSPLQQGKQDELNYAPDLYSSRWFGYSHSEATIQCARWNRHLDFLREWIREEPYRAWMIEPWIDQTIKHNEAWKRLRDALDTNNNITIRRNALYWLKGCIGDKAYDNGRMPATINYDIMYPSISIIEIDIKES